ncbi:hypothetical protein P7K49_038851 [Saguinus oedipus]|uniref:Uncharacterized protein n=1 Tax=Saguinus oedipus TaxID=9490 RepID=A0ABQ9TFU4_SAGOE|nr:hypothetical protein P7K49_038851 [Saguinus oedipus]
MLSWGLTLHSSWEKVSCPRGCSVSHAQLRLSSHRDVRHLMRKPPTGNSRVISLLASDAFSPRACSSYRSSGSTSLDGRELSPAMTVDMDSSELTKPCKVRKKDQARFGVL